MRYVSLLYLLVPLRAIAADNIDKEGHWITVAAIGAFFLYTVIKKPEWFRTMIKQRVQKHDKYVGWIREQSKHSHPPSDDEVWAIIEQGVTFKAYVTLALFFLLIVFIHQIYPLYAHPLLGPDPPYWQEVLLGITGGALFGAFMAMIGRISLRIRIRQLVDQLRNRSA